MEKINLKAAVEAVKKLYVYEKELNIDLLLKS